MAKKRAVKKTTKVEEDEVSSGDAYAAEDETHDEGVKKTPEELGLEMEEGKKDEEVYTEEGREKELENDEIEPWEEGFMEGAEGRGKKNCCSECGKLLEEEKEDIYEREFDDEIKLFCSEEHAEKYAKKLAKKKRK